VNAADVTRYEGVVRLRKAIDLLPVGHEDIIDEFLQTVDLVSIQGQANIFYQKDFNEYMFRHMNLTDGQIINFLESTYEKCMYGNQRKQDYDSFIYSSTITDHGFIGSLGDQAWVFPENTVIGALDSSVWSECSFAGGSFLFCKNINSESRQYVSLKQKCSIEIVNFVYKFDPNNRSITEKRWYSYQKSLSNN
jgi:hypothetical protein